jgi:hypothetical protein
MESAPAIFSWLSNVSDRPSENYLSMEETERIVEVLSMEVYLHVNMFESHLFQTINSSKNEEEMKMHLTDKMSRKSECLLIGQIFNSKYFQSYKYVGV